MKSVVHTDCGGYVAIEVKSGERVVLQMPAQVENFSEAVASVTLTIEQLNVLLYELTTAAVKARAGA